MLSTEAISFAFAAAAQRGDIVPLAYDPEQLRAEGERVLAEAVTGWAERHPEARGRRKLVAAAPVAALVPESADAQLVLVGAHGRGSLGGLLLGSVSHAVLHHARSPLTIVRHRRGHAAG